VTFVRLSSLVKLRSVSPRPSLVLSLVYIAQRWDDTRWVVDTAAPPLLPVFRSQLQGEVLALVLSDPAVEWTVGELVQRTGHPRQTVSNEVRRLEGAGLLLTRSVGRTKLMKANTDSPYYEPLARLALMSFGPPLVIAKEFGLIGGIKRILIYGSWAARYAGEQGPAPHDIDVLLIGAPDRDEVYEAARRAEERLGREVNTTIRKPEQWERAEDGFARQLQSSPLVEVPLGRSGT
jgi:predicted nucleotidyltransferase